MILYFTGTGNSRYIAEKIAKTLNDEVISLNTRIKNKDYSPLDIASRMVIVVPTYAWRMPRIVTEWLQKTEITGGKKTWFVLDCGDEIGDSAKYNKMLCSEKNLEYMGTAQVVMPENYIAMFNAPDKETADLIIKKADRVIDRIAVDIKDDKCFDAPANTLLDRLKSTVVNPLFYLTSVKADPFYVKGECITCGKCAELCPLNNISLKDGKPSWGRECTHCMACICYCPTEAIEYGRKSEGKPRYHLD